MNLTSLPISSKELRTFIGSCILPFALFLIAGLFIFSRYLPPFIYDQIFSNEFSSNFWLLFSIVVFGGGFYLYTIVNWTVRFFGGYYLPPHLSRLLVILFFRRPHREKTRIIKEVQQANRKQIADWERIIDDNYERAWTDYSYVELNSPMREEDLLPTRLGNVLLAIELYPRKYGIVAGESLWTRLAVLLPPHISNELEQTNNNMLFLLNSSLMAYSSSFLSFVLWLLEENDYLQIQANHSNFFGNSLKWLSGHEYLLLAVVLFLLGYLLYIQSVPVAKTMGLLIRSSFDLYRLDLLKQLNLPIPKTLSAERTTWIKLSDFIVTGGALGTIPLEFEYELRTELLSEEPPVRNTHPKKNLGKRSP